MDLSYKSLTTLVFWLTFMVLQSFEELVLLHHPTRENGLTRDLTCVSDFDDAALVWNFDKDVIPDKAGNDLSNFQPKNRPSRNDTGCAVWEKKFCKANWTTTDNWTSNNSAIDPMGPAFDYRWEDFKEYVFKEIFTRNSFEHVSKVRERFGSVFFSVRGRNEVHIVLCTTKIATTSSCFWINLAGNQGNTSTILSCPYGAPKKGQWSRQVGCVPQTIIQHDGKDILDLYEWRTFRLTWNSSDKSIGVFKGDDVKPFLEHKFTSWYKVKHIFVRSDIETRIRFHLYDYYWAKEKNSVLSTSSFYQYDKNFCMKLLVSLCSECTLNITLVDIIVNNRIPIKHISRKGEKSVYGGTVLWESFKIEKTLPRNTGAQVRLEMQTSMNDDQEMGHWAIDNFRMCESNESTRNSTITIRREKNSLPWPNIKCQKLSNNDSENAVVYLSDKRSHADAIQLDEFHREIERAKQSPSENSGPGWIICRSDGCVCDRGYTDVATECVKVSGEIRNFRYENISEGVILLRWDPSVEAHQIFNYTVSIKRDELLGCKNFERYSSPEVEKWYEITDTSLPVIVSELHSYARYTATVIAKPANPERPPTITFWTPEKNTPTAKISNLRFIEDKNRLEWNAPEDCTTISGRHETTKLYFFEKVDTPEENLFKREDIPAAQFYYDLKEFKLEPYTKYKVQVYISRSSGTAPENQNVYAELHWRTPPIPPKPVKGLEAYEVNFNENSTSLRWIYTESSASEIEFYVVSISQGEHTFPYQTYSVSYSELKCELWTDYVCLKNVQFKPGSSVKVSAKNKHVENPGRPDSIEFFMNWYKKQPGKPLNLTADPQNHGVVTLKWRHPSFTPVTIAKFMIKVEILSTDLIADPIDQYPIMQNYYVKKKQEEYQMTINVAASSRYRIFVNAVSQRNVDGVSVSQNVSVKSSPVFVTNNLDLKCDEDILRLTIPALVNATRNTTLHVSVTRFLTCEREESKSSLENQLDSKITLIDTKVTDEKPKILNIPVNKTASFMDICSEVRNGNYTIEVLVNGPSYEEMDHFPRFCKPLRLSQQGKPQKQNLLWLLLIIPLAMIILFFVYFRRNHQRLREQKNRHNSVFLSMVVRCRAPSNITSTPSAPKQVIKPPLPPPNVPPRSVFEQSKPDVVQPDPQSRPVKIEEFEDYAKEALANGLLELQYTQFPRGLSSTCRYAKLPEIKEKNRYKDRIPYDKNRVELEKTSDDPYSDYINASYIQGYRKTKAYIATQGPKPNTVNDFWRMVWQENVRVICMVANITENGKAKCEQYWPEVGSNEKYGDILVSNTSHEVLADYIVRSLRVEYENKTREITHLHYTGWPDHGVPMYTQSLVAYLKKILATPAGKGPVVVHCSAGVGRTGTIILCDICLRQAVVERIIDVPTVVTRLRGDRANMVDNAKQYCLAHLVILESIFTSQTQMQCRNDLPQQINEMRKQLPLDMQRLKDTVWQDRVLQSMWATGSLPHGNIVNTSESEFEEPPTFARVGNYSNVISVVGVKVTNQYLVSQLPSPSDPHKVWKMIDEMNVELVIILQNAQLQDHTPTCDLIMNQTMFIPSPHLQVVTESSFEDKHFTTHRLLLIDTSEKEEKLQPVTVIKCTGWGCDKGGVPPPVESLVSLWNSSGKIPRKESPALVLCRDGVTACGLYVALSFMLERMATDRECDVISAVRAVRRSNPGFVKSKEQFEYLYDAAINYFGCFETYANFA